MGRTTELRRALKKRFFPYVAERGFAVDEGGQPEATRFRRGAGTSVQIFEIQWDKYGRPRFALHFGTCPVDGLPLNGDVSPPENTLPGWCPDAGTLRPSRGPKAWWFRQDATLSQRLRGMPALRDPAGVVDDLLKRFPELERFWANGELGPHLKQWRR